MKIIDCVIFNDEKLLLDLRFNILNKIVDFFIVCESSLSLIHISEPTRPY